MPTFAEMPFTMDDVPDPLPEAGLPPALIQAIRLLFVEVVRKADDIATLSALESKVLLTVEEIEMVRTGMVIGATSLMEMIMEGELFDTTKFVRYLHELLKKSA